MLNYTPDNLDIDPVSEAMEEMLNDKKKKARVNLLTAPDGMYEEYVSGAAKHNVEFPFTEEQFDDFWVSNYSTYTHLSWR